MVEGFGSISMIMPDGTEQPLGNVKSVEAPEVGKKVKSISEKKRRRVVRKERPELLYTEKDLQDGIEKATRVAEIMSQPVKTVPRDGPTETLCRPNICRPGILANNGSDARQLRDSIERVNLYGNIERFHYETADYDGGADQYTLEFHVMFSTGARWVAYRLLAGEVLDDLHDCQIQPRRTIQNPLIPVIVFTDLIYRGLFNDLINLHGLIALVNAVYAGSEYMLSRRAPMNVHQSHANFMEALMLHTRRYAGGGDSGQ